ncbi:Sugar phosphate isomerase/epimerase [Mariniphaga anaerophila]|uniref:Sugar phosphate isomerase/epimerase n=1 Tax=Mariniphaga anaerophila TaxID=1484053 RepID=A0A1M4T997_9BACT|nr:sugar phosphate isomerase/epimerase [Mariniphaga anaerophila]SHE40995.1 Sugar phosphate isomerase/epimerase [Mariniphaga anaerophila]
MKTSQNRRDFFKVSAAGALGIMAFGPMACSPAATVDRKSFGVGLQLYTIRDAMAADVKGSLQKLSDMGYKNLELADYSNGKFYGYTPAEFKKMVNDMGMEILSSHTSVEAEGITMESAQKMADDHAELGVKYCVQPWVEEKDRNIETYKRMIADWNEVGRIMKNVGIQFAYHNHNFEFENMDGVVPYFDIFMPEMDADLITMEIDLFWATKAGQDPVEIFNKYPGRFQLFHLKDMYTQEAPFFDVIKDDVAPVGAGVIDFKRILAAADVAGMKHHFVEDDNQGNGKPFEALEISINNLTTDILKKA